MERIAATLCPNCTHCPGVIIDGDTIRIGEDANTVLLQREEWNVLVGLIQSGSARPSVASAQLSHCGRQVLVMDDEELPPEHVPPFRCMLCTELIRAPEELLIIGLAVVHRACLERSDREPSGG